MKRLNLGWPGVVAVAASTVLSWVAGTPKWFTPEPRPAAAPPVVSRPAGEPRAVPSLHEWRRPPAARSSQARDIFAFGRVARPAAAAPAAPPAGLFEPAPGAAPAAPTLFKLIGVAETAESDKVVRTAIISGVGQVYLVGEGETFAFYKVQAISSDAVELVDRSGSPVRLVMK